MEPTTVSYIGTPARLEGGLDENSKSQDSNRLSKLFQTLSLSPRPLLKYVPRFPIQKTFSLEDIVIDKRTPIALAGGNSPPDLVEVKIIPSAISFTAPIQSLFESITVTVIDKKSLAESFIKKFHKKNAFLIKIETILYTALLVSLVASLKGIGLALPTALIFYFSARVTSEIYEKRERSFEKSLKTLLSDDFYKYMEDKKIEINPENCAKAASLYTNLKELQANFLRISVTEPNSQKKIEKTLDAQVRILEEIAKL